MIHDMKSLTKVADILFSEGPILTLYKHKSQYVLCSFLKENLGTVYYFVTNDNLKRYLNSEITLNKIYLESDDFIVTQYYRKEARSFLKDEFADKIQCEESLFSQIDISMKNLEAINLL